METELVEYLKSILFIEFFCLNKSFILEFDLLSNIMLQYRNITKVSSEENSVG